MIWPIWVSGVSKSITRTIAATIVTSCAAWPSTWAWSVTGSSDYHGENKTIGLGDYTHGRGRFDKLVSAATGVEVLGR